MAFGSRKAGQCLWWEEHCIKMKEIELVTMTLDQSFYLIWKPKGIDQITYLYRIYYQRRFVVMRAFIDLFQLRNSVIPQKYQPGGCPALGNPWFSKCFKTLREGYSFTGTFRNSLVNTASLQKYHLSIKLNVLASVSHVKRPNIIYTSPSTWLRNCLTRFWQNIQGSNYSKKMLR